MNVLNQLSFAVGQVGFTVGQQASKVWGGSEGLSSVEMAWLERTLARTLQPMEISPEARKRIKEDLLCRGLTPGMDQTGSSLPWQTAAMVGSAVSVLGLAYWLYLKSYKGETSR